MMVDRAVPARLLRKRLLRLAKRRAFDPVEAIGRHLHVADDDQHGPPSSRPYRDTGRTAVGAGRTAHRQLDVRVPAPQTPEGPRIHAHFTLVRSNLGAISFRHTSHSDHSGKP